MRSDAPPATFETGADYDPETEVQALAAQTARLVGVAQALVNSNRHIDVEGLQDQIGLLCAKALDLPPSRSKLLRIDLVRLASAVDALSASLRANAA